MVEFVGVFEGVEVGVAVLLVVLALVLVFHNILKYGGFLIFNHLNRLLDLALLCLDRLLDYSNSIT